MERTEVIWRLARKLSQARAWKERTRREFDTNVTHGTGIPHSCGKLAIRDSSKEYQRAIEATDRAISNYADYFIKGTIPEDLLVELDDGTGSEPEPGRIKAS